MNASDVAVRLSLTSPANLHSAIFNGSSAGVLPFERNREDRTKIELF